MKNRLAIVLTVCACALAACSDDRDTKAAVAPTAGEAVNEQNLATALRGAPDLARLAQALESTGLSGVFANAGSYTLIAPTDAAFAKLGEKAQALNEEDQRAALTAVVRDHLVPGYLTRDDIAKAIEANGGRPVNMRTLGTGGLTFARSGNDISVTADDGTSGKLSGEPVLAGASLALPVDTVLKKV